MKIASILVLAFALSGTAAHAEQSIFSRIQDEAQVGNGSAKISRYDRSLSKSDLEAQGKRALEKSYWEGCGPWKIVTERRTAIHQIEKIESMGERTSVAQSLMALYDRKDIIAIAGAISNNKVECSLSWYNVYGADGTVLELRYNLGD